MILMHHSFCKAFGWALRTWCVSPGVIQGLPQDRTLVQWKRPAQVLMQLFHEFDVDKSGKATHMDSTTALSLCVYLLVERCPFARMSVTYLRLSSFVFLQFFGHHAAPAFDPLVAMVVKCVLKLRDRVWNDGRSYPQVADFLCPLTSNPMLDPVKAEDGHTYERKAIEKWLEENTVSPQTRKPMGKKLTPDKKRKTAIENYDKAHKSEKGTAEESRTAEDGAAMEISWPTGGHKSPNMEETRYLKIQPAASEEPKPKRARVDPEILQDGAGSSSMSEVLSKWFRELDPLRALLREVLEGWAPPRIVVIGNQSAGKSTILEQLANMPIFPRKDTFCTRLPTHLRLRRDPETSKAELSVYKIQPDRSEVKEGMGLVRKPASSLQQVPFEGGLSRQKINWRRQIFSF